MGSVTALCTRNSINCIGHSMLGLLAAVVTASITCYTSDLLQCMHMHDTSVTVWSKKGRLFLAKRERERETHVLQLTYVQWHTRGIAVGAKTSKEWENYSRQWVRCSAVQCNSCHVGTICVWCVQQPSFSARKARRSSSSSSQPHKRASYLRTWVR